ncbi:MAG TPA: GNAT family N-acetyltransferase [Acidimicrobiales bacterium]|nr:GNAT family N-acetyltransferase [Acidimicrobiales bacterium]
MAEVTAQSVRRAHGDAWQAVGADCARKGGGAGELPGVRLMATGLPHPQWNNGDVHDPAAVDLREVRDWYSRLDVPWGLRVPAGADWRHGRHLFRKRLMGATPASFRAPPEVAGLELRPAGQDDLDSILAVDVVAFEESPEVERPWLQLLLDHPDTTVAVAALDGAVVATGSVLRSDGWAGPAGYVAGIAVEPAARRRGIAAAVTSWLMQQAGDVDLWHLHPDTDAAARIYERLGFVEVDGLDIYIDV